MSIRVIEIDISSPVDSKLAINGLGGDPEIFYLMLGNLEGMSLTTTMQNIIAEYDSKNY